MQLKDFFGIIPQVKLAVDAWNHPDVKAPAPPAPPAPQAQSQIDRMIADILRKEGGYNDIRGDAGGATNKGISLRYLKGIGLKRGDLDHDGDIDKDDIRIVTPEIAARLYKEDFYLAPHIDRLPEPLQPIIFDIAVNSGPPRAIILLQKVLRAQLNEFIAADGVIGPGTRTKAEEALAKFGVKAMVNAVVDARCAWYNAIVREDPSQAKFLKGWLNRAATFRMK
ncbi:hypothetical protein GC176_20490 [bacterium]|nr:hypothetical protein [bacterium]